MFLLPAVVSPNVKIPYKLEIWLGMVESTVVPPGRPITNKWTFEIAKDTLLCDENNYLKTDKKEESVNDLYHACQIS
jgi:hypothetical protein